MSLPRPILLFSLFALSISILRSEEVPRLSSSQWQQLREGQPIVFPENNACPFSKGGKFTVGAIVVKDDMTSVWQLLHDQEAAADYIADLKRSKIVGRDGKSFLVEQDYTMAGLKTFHYLVKMQPLPEERKFCFKMVKGSVRDFEGSWTLFPMTNKEETLLIYTLFIQPSRLTPQKIVKNSLRKKIPETLLAVRGEVNRRSAQN